VTTSGSSSREFNVGKILSMAYIRAGLLDAHSSLDAARARVAKDELDLILDGLPAASTISRSRTTILVACTTGAASVTLPNNVLDVNGDGEYISPEQDVEHPDSETLVRLIDQGEWHSTGLRSASGVPTRMYLDRAGAALILRLMPVPNEAGTIRLKVRRMLHDAGADSNTVDLEPPWVEYLVLELAARLAMGNSLMSRAAFLRGEAKEKKIECQGFAGERVGKQLRFSHRAGWRR